MTLEAKRTSSASLWAEGNRLGQKTANTVLVVEDIAEIALHMKRRLVERGYEVIWAQAAEDAIQIAEQSSPTIILTDLDLPAFDSLVESVSKHRDLKELPVTVLDINHLELNDVRVKVLPDFDALDNFVHSL
jgi:DNA-binding response OmpR family regulator